MMTLKTILNKLLFAAFAFGFSFFVSCLVIEIGLRILTPEWLSTRMRELNIAEGIPGFNSDSNWKVEMVDGVFKRFKPLSSFRCVTYEYDETVHIDVHGARVTAIPSDSKEELIPFFGDSYTFGQGCSDLETTVSLLAEKTKYRLLNFGVPGTCLSNHLDTLDLVYTNIGCPKVCIFGFFIGNDFTDIYHSQIAKNKVSAKNPSNIDSEALTQNQISQYQMESINAYVYHHPFLKRLYLLQFIKAKALFYLNKSLTSKGIERHQDTVFFTIDKTDSLREKLEQALDLELKRLVEYSNKYHFTPIVFIFPDRHQISPTLLKSKIRYYGLKEEDIDVNLPNALLETKLNKYRILNIDTTPYFRNGQTNLFYVQDPHLTPLGYKIAAEGSYSDLSKILNALLK